MLESFLSRWFLDDTPAALLRFQPKKREPWQVAEKETKHSIHKPTRNKH
jgi:hypothetical protein